jgi:hypothetical protein
MDAKAALIDVMNPRTLGSSILLTIIVGAAVVLIGAFAHFDNSHGESSNAQTNLPAPVIASVATPALPTTTATTLAVPPTLPTDLSPGLAEIIKLAQSHVAEETLIAFIENSGKTYNPTAEELLYLNDLGLSEKVINALFKKPDIVAVNTSATPPATTAVATTSDDMVQPPLPVAAVDPAPLADPQDSYFYNDLAPYGSWVQVADVGWCWQPMVSSVDTEWVPYRDRGHWALTDEGWYWASDYSWGWAPFHYGRWSRNEKFGWVWSPGSVWSPAWVAWRNSDTFSGWAPLPPHALFRPGIGLFADAGLAGLDVSFGLGYSAFTFVSNDHFLAPRLTAFAAKPGQAAGFFQTSKPVNNYTIKGHKVINSGVSPDRIAAATKAPVRTFALQEAKSPETSGGRTRGSGLGLAVFRPDVSTPPSRQFAASASPQPVLINRASTEEAINSSAATAATQQGTPTRPGFSGFGDNFRASNKRINAPADVSTPTEQHPASWGTPEANRTQRPTASAPEPRFPNQAPPQAFAPRGEPPVAGNAYERREPANVPPPQAEPQNRGGGQVYPAPAQGNSSSASSTTSGNARNSNGK